MLILQTEHSSSLIPESDWSDEDWDGTKAKAQKETGETNLLLDWDLPKPQSEPDSKPDVDKLDIDKLHIEQDSPKEEQIEITNSLISPPMTSEEEEKAMMGRDNKRKNGRNDRSRKEIPTKRREIHTTGGGLHQSA